MENNIKKMNITELIDRAFRMSFSCLKSYLKIYGILVLIYLVLAAAAVLFLAIFIGFNNFDTITGLFSDPESFFRSNIITPDFSIIGAFSIVFVIFGILALVINSYYTGISLDMFIKSFRGEQWTYRESFEMVKSKIGSIIGASFLTILLVFAGVLACCIGYIPMMALVSLTLTALVFENLKAGTAVSRSFKLVGYSFWGVLGAWSLYFLIYIGVSMISGSLSLVLFQLSSAVSGMLNITIPSFTVTIIAQIIQICIGFIFSAFALSFNVCIYFNQKIKYENYGVESLVQDMVERAEEVLTDDQYRNGK